MKICLAFASVLTLACISVFNDTAMSRCMKLTSFDTCHHALNR